MIDLKPPTSVPAGFIMDSKSGAFVRNEKRPPPPDEILVHRLAACEKRLTELEGKITALLVIWE